MASDPQTTDRPNVQPNPGEATMTDLFSDLPEQKAPDSIWTDEHSLERCEQCRGEGRRRYSYYSSGYCAERGSEPCPHCNGAGKVIRYIGPASRHNRSSAVPPEVSIAPSTSPR
jgi:hypothetical protein